MAYPQFPIAGRLPAFLNPFDPTFQHQAYDALISVNASGQIPPVSYGGAVIDFAGWRGGVGQFALTPENALFGWGYIGIVPPGFSGTSPMRNVQGIVGPRRVYWQVEVGGLPFLT